MRPFYLGLFLLICCQHITAVRHGDSTKQIKLEDIERDNLESEKNANGELLDTEQSQGFKQAEVEETQETEKGESKESSQTDIQYAAVPLGYTGPSAADVTYVTPLPWAAGLEYINPKNLGQQYHYDHVPQVHEADFTYTVPSRQSLVKPTIGGGAPIQPVSTPQPQYVYVSAPGTAPGAGKTAYEKEQKAQQQQFGSLYAPSAPEPQYLAYQYQYQLQEPVVSPPIPPPVVSVPSPAVYSFSHGASGLGSYHASTARPFLYDTPAQLSQAYLPAKKVLPLPTYSYPTRAKYETSIEPQLVLGPFSLPPEIHYTKPFQPLPHPYPQYDLGFLPSPRHIGSYAPPLKLKVNFGSSGFSSPFSAYNTIAYSVPYSPTKLFKRDSKH